MNYKDAFAIEEKSCLNQNENDFKFNLKNYNHFEPRLIDDFYFKYFIRTLLFETKTIELRDFLQHHYDYCNNPELYYSILEFEVMPKIEEIIDNAHFGSEGRGYFNEELLEDGFSLSEGVIKNYDFDFPLMFHQTLLFRKQNEFKLKIRIINEFISDYKDKNVKKPLKWIAGPTQLGVIISELIDKGYMEADKRNGEINYASLSRDLFQAFSIKECDSPKSIEIYLSPRNKRNVNSKAVFTERGFSIPHADFT